MIYFIQAADRGKGKSMRNEQPLSPWEQIQRTFEEAERIQKLAALYRESGRTWKQSLDMAIEAHRQARKEQAKAIQWRVE